MTIDPSLPVGTPKDPRTRTWILYKVRISPEMDAKLREGATLTGQVRLLKADDERNIIELEFVTEEIVSEAGYLEFKIGR